MTTAVLVVTAASSSSGVRVGPPGTGGPDGADRLHGRGRGSAGLGLIHSSSAPELMKPLVEVTLVWVLFSDAARVRVHELRADLGRYVRCSGSACC